MILSALALFAASCGDGGDVRVVALTPTPASEQTPVRSIDGPATIITATPTAGPIEGTATPTATVTASAGEPPEPPKRPEQPLASALLLRDYLATGEANLPGCLPELVSAWELAPTSGARCLFADFDGDGASEFAFAVTLADGGGDIWFYESAEDEYRLLTSARVLLNATLDGVTIDAIADLTGDRFPDLVISALRCGDAGCERQLLIVSTHRGRLENLAPAGLGDQSQRRVERRRGGRRVGRGDGPGNTSTAGHHGRRRVRLLHGAGAFHESRAELGRGGVPLGGGARSHALPLPRDRGRRRGVQARGVRVGKQALPGCRRGHLAGRLARRTGTGIGAR